MFLAAVRMHSRSTLCFSTLHMHDLYTRTCVRMLDYHIPTFAVHCRMEVGAPWVHQQDILQGHVADVSCAVPMHGPRKLVKQLVVLSEIFLHLCSLLRYKMHACMCECVCCIVCMFVFVRACVCACMR